MQQCYTPAISFTQLTHAFFISSFQLFRLILRCSIESSISLTPNRVKLSLGVAKLTVPEQQALRYEFCIAPTHEGLNEQDE